MNTITTEEIDRLLRLVHPVLRESWENKFNKGKSLVDMAKQRLVAKKKYRLNRTIGNVTLPITGIYSIAAMFFAPQFNNGQWFAIACWLVPFSILSLLFVVSAKKHDHAKELVEKLDETFTKFSVSIGKLNPLGIGNRKYDSIDALYVSRSAEHLALHVLDAQIRYDAFRSDSRVSRNDLIESGKLVERSETNLAQFLMGAKTDFDFKMDKEKIFAKASKILKK